GRLEIACVYESVSPFNSNGFAVVKQDGVYKVIVDSGYTYGLDELGIQDVVGINNKYVLAKYNDKYGYYNYDFQCVSNAHQYDQITVNNVGYAAVGNDGKWGFISDSGEIMSEMVFDDIALNSLGYVFTRINYSPEQEIPVGCAKRSDVWYLVYPDGSKITETGFAGLKAPEGNGWVAASDAEGKWGFVDLDGTVQIPFQYEDAWSFSENLAAVKKDGEWVYINIYNDVVIDENFENALPFHGGIAQAHEDAGIALLSLVYVG
ncbi:MAG: WG repeat-containing protein, partial [Clostridia bacterium]|nr:WG repeat-containing protein [Clostridia bacterium]